MNLKNAWKQPIYRDDLMPVLRSGIFMSITGGLIIGTLHLLFLYYLKFSLSWLLLLILAHLMAKRISQSYKNFHILYAIISVFFFIVSFYIMRLTSLQGIYFISGLVDFKLFISLLNPVLYFGFLNPLRSSFFQLENILDIVFFVIGIVYSYRFSK